MLFKETKLTDALREPQEGWSGDASAVDADVALAAANLLDTIRATCDVGLNEDTRSALLHIKYLINDAIAPYFADEAPPLLSQEEAFQRAVKAGIFNGLVSKEP